MTQPLDDRDVAPWAEDEDQEEREAQYAEMATYPSEGPVY